MAQFQPTESSLIDLAFDGDATADLSADVSSDPVYLNGTNNYTLEYTIEVDSAEGILELQCSNSENNPNYTMVTFHTISTDTTGGVFNVDKAKYRYVKIVYTSTAGTATMTANINLGVS